MDVLTPSELEIAIIISRIHGQLGLRGDLRN
jgi:hypothetical protein